MTSDADPAKQRKLRVLIISMGGRRQEVLQDLFASHLSLRQSFEPPTFCSGIPSRSLRSREPFFRHCQSVGLLPEAEWEALQEGFVNPQYQEHREQFFDCLKDVPIPTEGRRGSECDLRIHYSEELWRKAKTVNRGRAVLACALAHLSAMKRLVEEGFDLLLEDNVRFPIDTVAQRIRETMDAVQEWETETGHCCHIRYFGWLGSTTNLEWIASSHIPHTKFERNRTSNNHVDDNAASMTCFPMPTLQDIEADLATHHSTPNRVEISTTAAKETSNSNGETTNHRHEQPGGNPVWGAYAYWISKEAYSMILELIRNDVGALLWKSKRMRYYHVKPIDKILPRQIRDHFESAAAIQLSTHPAFFRAPMLTSHIHAKWDAEFCKSTTFQLRQSGLRWSDLALTPEETQVVQQYENTGNWLSLDHLADIK